MTSTTVPANLCRHGIDASRPGLCSICREDAHAEAVELDERRTMARAFLSTPSGARLTDDEIEAALQAREGANERLAQLTQEPKVSIHTAGELHSAPPIEGRVTFTFNLSDLLDDPAHKPEADLVRLDGLDARVQDFVFATDGALDLYEDMVRLIETQLTRGMSVTVLILCRGGKHRSVAFGDNLAAHFSVEATHHHKHLPRVVSS